MNKFPLLNNLRGFYVLIAGLILIGGCIAAVAMADAAKIATFNSFTGQYTYQPNIGVGIIVFVLSVALASTFILTAELISLGLRVENHLDKIQITLKRAFPNTSEIHVAAVDKTVEEVYVEEENLAAELESSTDYSTKKNQRSSKHIIEELIDFEFNVTTSTLIMYSEPTVQSDVLYTFYDVQHIIGLERDTKGVWLFVQHPTKDYAGWVKASDLDAKSDDIKELPVR